MRGDIFDLSGKVAVVTGRPGLGLAMGQALANPSKSRHHGYNLEKATVGSERIKAEYDVDTLAFQADVRKPNEVQDVVAKVLGILVARYLRQ